MDKTSEVNSPDEQPKKRNLKSILPGILVSIICLVIVFYMADFEQLLAALRNANPVYLALGVLATLGWVTARSFVWGTLLQNKATYSQVFFTLNEGYLLNNILPFRLGEVGRSLLLARKASLNFWEVFSTVIIERILDIAMAASLLLITIPFVVGASWAVQAAVLAGVAVLGGIGLLYLLALNQDRVVRIFTRVTGRWEWVSTTGSRQLQAFLKGLSVITDAGVFIRAILWMIVNWTIGVLLYSTILTAFLPESAILWAAFTLGVSSFGIATPSSPGAVGVFELSMVAALSVFNIEASVALAVALAAHSLNYLVTGIIGLFALSRDGETLLGLWNQLRNFSPHPAEAK
jgi:uncharacterized protein (TIRG00374 family)